MMTRVKQSSGQKKNNDGKGNHCNKITHNKIHHVETILEETHCQEDNNRLDTVNFIKMKENNNNKKLRKIEIKDDNICST